MRLGNAASRRLAAEPAAVPPDLRFLVELRFILRLTARPRPVYLPQRRKRMRPGPGPDENPPPAVPPDVERRLRELSQPGRAADPYVLTPPPAAPPQATVG